MDSDFQINRLALFDSLKDEKYLTVDYYSIQSFDTALFHLIISWIKTNPQQKNQSNVKSS